MNCSDGPEFVMPSSKIAGCHPSMRKFVGKEVGQRLGQHVAAVNEARDLVFSDNGMSSEEVVVLQIRLLGGNYAALNEGALARRESGFRDQSIPKCSWQ